MSRRDTGNHHQPGRHPSGPHTGRLRRALAPQADARKVTGQPRRHLNLRDDGPPGTRHDQAPSSTSSSARGRRAARTAPERDTRNGARLLRHALLVSRKDGQGVGSEARRFLNPIPDRAIAGSRNRFSRTSHQDDEAHRPVSPVRDGPRPTRPSGLLEGRGPDGERPYRIPPGITN